MNDIVFNKNFDHVLGVEGGYSNNPADSGGETWRGIARKFWPAWEGWAIVDAAKSSPNFPASLAMDVPLSLAVRAFYRHNFWDVLNADIIAELSPRVAGELFEQAVNCGTAFAATNLQKCLNSLNNLGKRWPDLVEDGALGDRTVSAIAALFAAYGAEGEGVLLTQLNVLQGAHYINLPRQAGREKDEQFVYGWFLRRVKI